MWRNVGIVRTGNRLADALGEPLPEYARNDVGVTAWRVRDDQFDWT